MFFFRHATLQDIPALRTLDIRCFYEPWSEDIWDFCIQTYWIRLGIYNRAIVGMIVAGLDDERTDYMRIMKVGVGPGFRKRKLSIELLGKAVDYARDKDRCYLDCWMPEHYIYPTDAPWCIQQWITKVGFKYKEIQHDMYENQGYLESGLRWEMPIC